MNKKLQFLIEIKDKIDGIDRSIAALDKFKVRSKSAGQALQTALGFLAANVVAKLLGLFSRLAVEGPKALIKTRLEADKIINTLRFVEGSIEGANAAFQRQLALANRLGQDFPTVAAVYAKITAASKGTNLEGEKTEKIFEAILTAGTALQLNQFDMVGALNAVQQMMSKGNVQAEELRGQLGERLPGAFDLARRALGVTTVELNKMLDRGEVLASDLLPKLSDLMLKTFSRAAAENAKSLGSQIAQFNTAVFQLKLELADAGASGAFNEILNQLKSTVTDTEFKQSLRDLVGLLSSVASIGVKIGEESANFISLLSQLGEFAGTGISQVAFGVKDTQSTSDRLNALRFPAPVLRPETPSKPRTAQDALADFRAKERAKELADAQLELDLKGKILGLEEKRKELETDRLFKSDDFQGQIGAINELIEARQREFEQNSRFIAENETDPELRALELKQQQLELANELIPLEMTLALIKERKAMADAKSIKLTEKESREVRRLDTALAPLDNAIENLIVSGQSFGRTFLGVLRQIIAQLIIAIIKATILRAILGAFGVGGKVLDKVAPGLKSVFGGGGVSAGGGFTPPFLGGKSSGGFTGPGGKFEPAGIVHRGEFVFDAESTRALGPGNLQSLMQSVKVSNPALPTLALGGLASGSGARPFGIQPNRQRGGLAARHRG